MNYPVVVKNVHICDDNREYYKYIVVRELENEATGKMEYWYWCFYNDLYSASMAMRETGNGIVLELKNVIDEFS